MCTELIVWPEVWAALEAVRVSIVSPIHLDPSTRLNAEISAHVLLAPVAQDRAVPVARVAPADFAIPHVQIPCGNQQARTARYATPHQLTARLAIDTGVAEPDVIVV